MSDLMVTYLTYFLTGLCVLIVGFAMGYVRGRIRKINRVGVLTINYDDPTKELLGFRFEKDLPEIEKSRYISFEVIVEGSPDSDPENSQGENS
jgi:hypothetical protein